MSEYRLFAMLLVGCQVAGQSEPASDDGFEPEPEPVSDDGLDLDRGAKLASALAADPSDCSMAITVPGPQWQPTSTIRIPVVVHIIADAGCTTGAVSNATVANQIAALNEEYRATP